MPPIARYMCSGEHGSSFCKQHLQFIFMKWLHEDYMKCSICGEDVTMEPFPEDISVWDSTKVKAEHLGLVTDDPEVFSQEFQSIRDVLAVHCLELVYCILEDGTTSEHVNHFIHSLGGFSDVLSLVSAHIDTNPGYTFDHVNDLGLSSPISIQTLYDWAVENQTRIVEKLLFNCTDSEPAIAALLEAQLL